MASVSTKLQSLILVPNKSLPPERYQVANRITELIRQ
jgi:hypothetical protein